MFQIKQVHMFKKKKKKKLHRNWHCVDINIYIPFDLVFSAF